MEWIVFGVLIWLVFSRKGRTLFHGDGPSFRRQQRMIDEGTSPATIPVQRSETVEVRTRTEGAIAGTAATAGEQLPPPRTREEKMRQLRDLYVADEITVEEYERRLDALMRESPKAD